MTHALLCSMSYEMLDASIGADDAECEAYREYVYSKHRSNADRMYHYSRWRMYVDAKTIASTAYTSIRRMYLGSGDTRTSRQG